MVLNFYIPENKQCGYFSCTLNVMINGVTFFGFVFIENSSNGVNLRQQWVFQLPKNFHRMRDIYFPFKIKHFKLFLLQILYQCVFVTEDPNNREDYRTIMGIFNPSSRTFLLELSNPSHLDRYLSNDLYAHH